MDDIVHRRREAILRGNARWRRRRRIGLFAFLLVISTAWAGSIAVPPPSAEAVEVPSLEASVYPLVLPDGAAVGDISAVAIDRRDHLWVLHRPATVTAPGATPAPPVLEFDAAGRFVRGVGGPGAGYDWPTVEHSIAVAASGHVWIAGSFRADPARADDMVIEFTGDGRFVKQIGGRGTSRGNADIRSVHAPGDLFVDDARGELYVADGYGNRRVIVFDAETGRFLRMWGAFGHPPPEGAAPVPRTPGQPFEPEGGPGPDDFNGVHGVEIAADGTVYVSDRNNQRIQSFTRDGRYLDQFFVDRDLRSAQTASGIAFSADSGQRYLYVADWGNGRLLVYDRATAKLLRTVGPGEGSPSVEFSGPHLIATDSHGAIYVAEVQGRRVRKLTISAQ